MPANSRWDLIQRLNNLNDPVLNVLRHRAVPLRGLLPRTWVRLQQCPEIPQLTYETNLIDVSPNRTILKLYSTSPITSCEAEISFSKQSIIFFLLWRCDPTRVMVSSFLMFLDHKRRRSTVGRTPLDEWSTRRRDLYLTAHNTHNRQTSTSPSWIRTHDLSRRAAADLRLRSRGHWDRQGCVIR